MNVRQIALRLLCEYEAGEKYINLSLSSHAADKLSREDRAALTALLYTTVEHKLPTTTIFALFQSARMLISIFARRIFCASVFVR